jgi:hypothetical protein
MLIDIVAPPSDENILSITQSDNEVLIVFTIISPFSSYLRKVLQAVAKTPPSGENKFIRNIESYLLVVVCLHFPHLSHRFRVIRVKTYRQQQRRPIAEKTFAMNSPTPISYWWFVDIFRLSLTVSELFACRAYSVQQLKVHL